MYDQLGSNLIKHLRAIIFNEKVNELPGLKPGASDLGIILTACHIVPECTVEPFAHPKHPPILRSIRPPTGCLPTEIPPARETLAAESCSSLP